VNPDLAVYGKAIANGYPIAALAGRREIMNRFADPDPKRRVFLAGTYNGHPLPVSAAIATIECLRAGNGEIHRRLEYLGQKLEEGFSAFKDIAEVPLTLVRQGSAFCIYFMDHPPVDWHDIAAHHDFAADVAMRKALLEEGILFFPLATKQCSISAAHTDEMIETTLACVSHAIRQPVSL
jgi:glutamate-1-semialdehyde 2,1-aminomutase